MVNKCPLAFAALLLLPACGASDSGSAAVPPAQPTIAKSQLARQTSPVVDPADAAALAEGNTAFALDLHGLLRQGAPGKNLFYSPLSMSLALGMTYAGARGDTAIAMAKALHVTLPQEKLHPAINQLDLALASRGQGAKGADGLPFRLRVVDSLWGHKTTTFVPAFLDTLATNYGAGIYLEDFVTAPEAARTDINAWVDMQTEKRIPELMPKGSISSDVRFVIVNAVYFNAGWAEPFLPGGTSPKPFHGGDGATADVPTMTGNYAHVAYGEGDGWKVVTLPYDGGEVASDVALPDAGRFDEIEAAMTPTWLTSVRAFQKSRPGTLYLPKFEVQGETFSVRDSLTKLGMGIAFSDAADFSGITSNDHFTLFDVMHQAFVKVDEKGTEAAAATAVAGGTASAPVDPFTMTVDRPFLFFVRDVATGTLLFVGRISSPALSELARGRAPNRFAGGGPCVGRGIDSSPSVPPAPTAEVRAATDAHCVAAWKCVSNGNDRLRRHAVSVELSRARRRRCRRVSARARTRLSPAFVTTVALSVTACGSTSAGDATGTGGAATTSMGGSAATGDASKGGSAGGSAMNGGTGGTSSGAGGSAGGTGGMGGNPAACPQSHPLMNALCTSGGVACTYPSVSCAEVMSCVNGRWKHASYVSNGFCNPPAPCPDYEPFAGANCASPSMSPGGPAHGCRYPHAGCFTYWDCASTPAEQVLRWVSSGPASDGCCPGAAPAADASCAALAAQCTYPSEVATCSATGWKVSAPLPGGAGGAGSGGSTGAGGNAEVAGNAGAGG